MLSQKVVFTCEAMWTIAFRTEQAGVTSLSTWNIFAPSGSTRVCNFAISGSTPGTTVPPSTSNIVLNNSFESGTVNWTFHSDGSGTFLASTPASDGTKAAVMQISTAGSNVQLYQFNLPLQPSTRYRLEFSGKSNTGHNVGILIHKHGSPYTNYGLNFTADLTSTYKTFSREFTTSGFTSAVTDARLRFWLAPYDAAGDVFYIDKVILTRL